MMPDLLATKVLKDCETAFSWLKITSDENERRLFWILCITLLKAVDDVLEDVDRKSNPRLRAIIKPLCKKMGNRKRSS